ncbi:MAG: hypothetical protein M1549_02820 [Candidatus Dependentiae bacterium]|nr:hypothetical protein [Candidatus Dependentiae bacterium]
MFEPCDPYVYDKLYYPENQEKINGLYLCKAIQECNSTHFYDLLKCCSKVALNTQYDGMTPLAYVEKSDFYRGDPKMVIALLKQGAIPTFSDGEKTASQKLQTVIIHDNVELLKLLIAKGLDTSILIKYKEKYYAANKVAKMWGASAVYDYLTSMQLGKDNSENKTCTLCLGKFQKKLKLSHGGKKARCSGLCNFHPCCLFAYIINQHAGIMSFADFEEKEVDPECPYCYNKISLSKSEKKAIIAKITKEYCKIGKLEQNDWWQKHNLPSKESWKKEFALLLSSKNQGDKKKEELKNGSSLLSKQNAFGPKMNED